MATGYDPVAERYRRRRHSTYSGGSSQNRYREKEKSSGADKNLIRLCICAALLAVMIVMKAAYPQVVAGATETILPIIEKNVDYKGAVTAIGEAFSGQADIKEVLGEIYVKAFGMESGGELESSAGAEKEVITPVDALVAAQKAEGEARLQETIRRVKLVERQEEEAEAAEAERAAAEAAELESAETTDTTAASDDSVVQAFLESQEAYSDYALPINVTYEKPELGIIYQVPSTAPTSSGFGYREHPIEGGVLFHFGLDFAANTGDPITAFSDGTVTAVGESTTAGNYIRVQHANGVVTQYDHCSEIIASEGDMVTMGGTIALVGATGNATGPHLHLELQVNGMYVNPAYYLTKGTL